MAGNNFHVQGRADLDLSSIISQAQTAQNALNKLKLPSNLESNFQGLFSKLNKEIETFQTKMQGSFKNLSEVNSVQKSFEKIQSLITSLNNQIKSLDSSKLKMSGISGSSKEITQLASQMKVLQDQMKNLGTYSDEAKTKLDQLKANHKLKINTEDIVKAAQDGQALNEQLERLRNKTGEDITIATGNLNVAISDVARYEKELEKAKIKLDELLLSEKNVDSSTFAKAEADIAKLEASLTKANQAVTKTTIELQRLQQTKGDLDGAAGALTKVSEEANKINLDKINSEFEDLSQKAQELNGKQFQEVAEAVNDASNATQGLNKEVDNLAPGMKAFEDNARGVSEFNNEMNSLQSKITHVFGLVNGFNLLKKAIKGAYDSVAGLDKAMTDIAVVTDFNIDDLWAQREAYSQMASELGATTKGAYEVAQIYYQQGLNTAEVAAANAETLKFARIAGIEYADATDYMTTAIRGFKLEMEDTNRVNDVFSSIAAKTASSQQEIAEAVSRTASIAENAGMSLESTSAFLAQMIETTREAPENLGTAMKTIIARFQEMKKPLSEIEEVDGEIVDVNKVDKALASVGVALKDTTGQFRELDSVFLELAGKWEGLEKDQQRYIATTAAGSRQQSRFIAMMNNYERTVEIMGFANDSAGESQKQFEKTLDSLETKVNQLKNAWEQFVLTLADSTLIKGVVDLITNILNGINKVSKAMGGFGAVFQIALIAVGLKAGKALFTNIIAGVAKATKQMGAMGRTAGQAYSAGFQSTATKSTSGFQKIFNKDFWVGVIPPIPKEAIDTSGIIAAMQAQQVAQQAITEASTKDMYAQALAEDALRTADANLAASKIALGAATGVSKLQQDQFIAAVQMGIPVEQAAVLLSNQKVSAKLKEALATGVYTEAQKKEITQQILSNNAQKAGILSRVKGIAILMGQSMAALFSGKAFAAETKAKLAATTAQYGFNAAVMANPLTWIIVAIVAATVAFVALYNAINPSTEALKENADKMREVSDASKEVYTNLKDQIKNYKNLGKEFAELDKDSEGYAEKLEEIQNNTWDLIDTYPDLVMYLNEEGSLFDKNGELIQEAADALARYANEARKAYLADQLETDIEDNKVRQSEIRDYQNEGKEKQARKDLSEIIAKYTGESYAIDIEWYIDTKGGNFEDWKKQFEGTVRQTFTTQQWDGTTLFDQDGFNKAMEDIKNAFDQFDNLMEIETKNVGSRYDAFHNANKATIIKNAQLFADDFELGSQVIANAISGYYDSWVAPLEESSKNFEDAFREAFSPDEIENIINILQTTINQQVSALAVGLELDLTDLEVSNTLNKYIESLYDPEIFSDKSYDQIRWSLSDLSIGLENAVKDALFTANENGDYYFDPKIEFADNLTEDQRIIYDQISGVGNAALDGIKVAKNKIKKAGFINIESILEDGSTNDPILKNFFDQIDQSDRLSTDAVTNIETIGNILFEKATAGLLEGQSGYDEAMSEAKNNITQQMTELATLFNDSEITTYQISNLTNAFATGLADSIEAAKLLNGGLQELGANTEIIDFFEKSISDLDIDTSLEGQWKTFANSSAFSEIKNKIKDIVKENGKLTTDDVIDLRTEYEDLAYMLDETSVSAEIAAAALTMIGEGRNGFILLNVEAEKVLTTLKNLTTDMQSVNEELDAFNQRAELGNQDDAFNEYVNAYDTAMAHIEEGRINANDVWNFGELIFGSSVWQMDAESLIERIKGVQELFTADTSGAGVVSYLDNALQKGDEVSEKLAELGVEVAKDGDFYDLTIPLENYQAVANEIGITKEALTALIEAHKVFGSMDLSDESGLNKLKQEVQETDFAFKDATGSAKILGSAAFNTLAAQAGITAEDLAYLRQELEADGFAFLDIKAPIEDFKNTLNSIQGINLNTSGLTDNVISTLGEAGATAGEIAEKIQALGELNPNMTVNIDGLEEVKSGAELAKIPVDELTAAVEANASVATPEGQFDPIGESAEKNQSKVDKLRESIIALDGENANVSVTADTNDALNKLNTLQTKINNLKNTNITLPSTSIPPKDKGQYIKSAAGGHKPTGRSKHDNGPILIAEERPEIVYENGIAYIATSPQIIDANNETGVISGEETEEILKRKNKLEEIGGSAAKTKVPVIQYNNAAANRNSGGGKKGNSGSKSDSSAAKQAEEEADIWKNPYDWLYNLLERINEEIRTREKLERRYNKILKKNTSTTADLLKNYREQEKSLLQQLEYYNELYSKRHQEANNVEAEYSDLNRFAHYNEEAGVIEIDWDAIEAVTDTDTGERIEEYISRLEEIQSSIEDAEDALMNIEDQLEEIKERGKDQYDDLESRVYDALIAQQQEMIDNLNDINDSINDSNARLIQSIQTAIDKDRQARDQEKAKEAIEEKQRRLSLLQQDTSGVNDLEIRKLEKEIAEAQQSYTDSLIDKAIQEIQENNDLIAEQREFDIEVLQNQLDWKAENGQFWQEAYRLISDAFGLNGSLKSDSALALLLKNQEEWTGLSEIGQKSWWDALTECFIQGFEWYARNNDIKDLVGKTVGFTDHTGKQQQGKVNSDGTITVGNYTYNAFRAPDGSIKSVEAPAYTPPAPPSTPAPAPAPAAPKPLGVGVRVHANGYGKQDSYGGGRSTSRADWTGTIDKYVAGRSHPYHMSNENGAIGWYKPENLIAYKAGGLADFTGPAWLDGTKSKPEIVLNATDTANLIQLKEILADVLDGGTSTAEKGGDNYFDIHIEVESLSDDYDVEQLADKVKKIINEDSRYRNVNVINMLR